jgi:hypothetical protein
MYAQNLVYVACLLSQATNFFDNPCSCAKLSQWLSTLHTCCRWRNKYAWPEGADRCSLRSPGQGSHCRWSRSRGSHRCKTLSTSRTFEGAHGAPSGCRKDAKTTQRYSALDSEFRDSVPGLQTFRVLILRPLWFRDFDVIETDKPAQLMFRHPNSRCFAPQEKKKKLNMQFIICIQKIPRYSAFWSENRKGFQNAKMDIASLSSNV